MKDNKWWKDRWRWSMVEKDGNEYPCANDNICKY